MNTKSKKIGVLLLVLIAVIIVGFTMYNKPHLDVAASKADVVITAGELVKHFEEDETAANKKFLDQLIQIKGKVKNLSYEKGKPVITLEAKGNMGDVMCHLPPQEPLDLTIKIGSSITVKGICTGYLLDVVMVKCVITNQ
ncbi:hypothetical protein [Aquimarina sp. SS2-1]|uniref:OB-fold protein n=1 Tax=Aquimarina besae TaxID=3342247 RepID=UPI00366AD790